PLFFQVQRPTLDLHPFPTRRSSDLDFKTATFSDGVHTIYHYTLLVPDDALLAFFDHLHVSRHTDAVYSPAYNGYTTLWYYRLDSAHLTSDRLDWLIDQLTQIQFIIGT